MDSRPVLRSEDYTVGWLCAIAESELTAARKMLDRSHKPPSNPNRYDENTYDFGDINGHNVLIVCMPPGQPGLVSAQKLVQPLKQSFPKLGIHLFVGIGGGIPRNPSPEDPNEDIHLGDVVVGWADRTGIPAVIQYDHVRLRNGDNSSLLGLLDKPSRQLLNALNPILSDREMKETKFHGHLQRLAGLSRFQHPGLDKDILFRSNYSHHFGEPTEPACGRCDRHYLAKRPQRETTVPQFHQGTILSGSSIMENARVRDELSKKYYDAICFEMEAAGVVEDTHCLIIRGISDYSDNHKPPGWRHYAAATAAAFAREILYTLRPALVETIKSENNDSMDEILSVVEQGERFAKPQGENIGEGLAIALGSYSQARGLLEHSSTTDPYLNLRVYFRLMTVECDLSHDSGVSLNARLEHLQRAEEYGARARTIALDSPKAGAVAQVRLEQAFLKGRKAELEDKIGADPMEIRRMKDEAIKDIESSMKQLQGSNKDKHKEYETRVSNRQQRLSDS